MEMLHLNSVLLLVLQLFVGCEAHLRALISGRYYTQQRAQRAISEECLALARGGDCRFYSCFEARHPCSEENFMMTEGWRYCQRFQSMVDRFTPKAQQWLNGTRHCTMTHLLTLYRKETVNCHRLRHEGRAIRAACNAQHDMCDVSMLMRNKEALAAIYRPHEVFEAACQFFRNVRSCGLWKMRHFLAWAARQVNLLKVLFSG